jgi:hypothetical protein
MLNFLAMGNWDSTQVRARPAESSRRIMQEVERIIDIEWEQSMRRPDVKLFDGPMCRLESYEASYTELRLALSRTNYKTFLGTNLTHREFGSKYGRDVMANPVGVSPALLCNDGYLLFGVRNATVAYYPNRLHPFAGSLDPRDQLDVFAAVRRELHEELSLTDEHIGEIRCTGIVEDIELLHPELIFMVNAKLSCAEIADRLDPQEHHASHALRANPDIVEKMLAQQNPAFTPVAIATAMLWGRIAFGEEWFDHHQSIIARLAT